MLDFKCPVCGGDVTVRLSYGSTWATLDFKCCGCGRWADIDITGDAEEAMQEAMGYFDSIVKRVEGGK